MEKKGIMERYMGIFAKKTRVNVKNTQTDRYRECKDKTPDGEKLVMIAGIFGKTPRRKKVPYETKR